ncbi:hypothetical protein GCM10027062_44120 [Nocardioides hungaricus]
MRRGLFRQVRADLLAFRLESVLVLVMLLASSATLMVGLTVYASATSPWERLFDETDGAHAWFFTDDAQTDLTPIGKLAGVSQTSGPYRSARASVSNPAGASRYDAADLLLLAMPTPEPSMGRPRLLAGRWLSGASGEVVLDHNVADFLGLTVGSRATLAAPSGSQPAEPRSLRVVGLAVFPGRGPWPSWSPAASFVSATTLADLAPAQQTGSAYAVRLDDPAASSAFLQRATDALPSGAIGFSVDWQRLRSDAAEESQFTLVFIAVFTAFALLAAALVIANVIGGRALAQSRELGLLKAIGFTPRQLTGLFLVEHLILGLVGGVLGILAGWALAPLFVARTARAFGVPNSLADVPLTAMATLVILEALVVVFVALPAWRIGRLPTVRAIAGDYGTPPAAVSRVARLAGWLRLPQPVVLAGKDTFGRRRRAGRTVLALALTLAVTILALSVEATVQRLISDPTLTNQTLLGTLDPGSLSQTEVHQLLAAHPEVTAVPAVRVNGTVSEVDVQATALGEGSDRLGYVTPAGRMFATDGEAVVGQGLLLRLHRQIGDDITFTVDGRPLKLRIVGRYLAADHNGLTAMFSLDTLSALAPPGQQITPNAYLLAATGSSSESSGDPEALKRALVQASDGRVRVELAGSSSVASDAGQVRAVLSGLVGLVALIGALNLLMTSALGVREQTREIGTIRAIGITPRQSAVTVITGVVLLTALAALIGVPVGLGIGWLVVSAIGLIIGAGAEIATTPPPLWLVILVLATLLLAGLAGLFPAWRAARLRIADALRHE